MKATQAHYVMEYHLKEYYLVGFSIIYAFLGDIEIFSVSVVSFIAVFHPRAHCRVNSF